MPSTTHPRRGQTGLHRVLRRGESQGQPASSEPPFPPDPGGQEPAYSWTARIAFITRPAVMMMVSLTPTSRCSTPGQRGRLAVRVPRAPRPPVNVSYPTVNPFGDTVPTVGDFLTISIRTWNSAFDQLRTSGSVATADRQRRVHRHANAKSSFYTPVAGFGKRLRAVTATNAQGSASRSNELHDRRGALPARDAAAERQQYGRQPVAHDGNVGRVDAVDIHAPRGGGAIRLATPFVRADSGAPRPHAVVAGIGFTLRVWISSNLRRPAPRHEPLVPPSSTSRTLASSIAPSIVSTVRWPPAHRLHSSFAATIDHDDVRLAL